MHNASCIIRFSFCMNFNFVFFKCFSEASTTEETNQKKNVEIIKKKERKYQKSFLHHKCDNCDMVFFSKNALAEHEAKVPKDQRSWKGDSLVFNCSSCNFKSCSTSGLQIHEKKHTTSKMDLRIHEKMYKSTNMFYDGVPRGLSLKEISIDVDFVKPNYPCDTCNMVSQSISCFSYYYLCWIMH